MNSLNEFLTSGKMPTSHKERSALLDTLRHQILTTNQNNNMQVFRQNPITGQRETITGDQLQAEAKAAALAVARAKQDLGNIRATHQADKDELARLKGRRATAPVIHRAAVAPVAVAKPATVAPAIAEKRITAAEFAIPRTTMLRSEFDKLSHPERNRYIREGGKLIADPKPAKKTTR
jgi:hypothetical protein